MFTVYSKPACPACDQAKAMLRQRGVQYTEVILDVGQRKIEGAAYIDRASLIEKFPTARTVPQITQAGWALGQGEVHIGGLTELKDMLDKENPVAIAA